MISIPVIELAVGPPRAAGYRAAILCHGTSRQLVLCSDMSGVEVKADSKAMAAFGRK
jgi:hypothetical protein